MPNMTYCQWRNFKSEIHDAVSIQAEADFDPNKLSAEEQQNYKRCIELCQEFIDGAQDFCFFV